MSGVVITYVPSLLTKQSEEATDGEKGARKTSRKGSTGASNMNTGTVSGNPSGKGVEAGGGPNGPNGGPGGDGGGGGPGPPSGPSGSTANPSHNLTRRVLVLSQKGDWVACEATLRMLEKEIADGGATKPLFGVADNVRYCILQ